MLSVIQIQDMQADRRMRRTPNKHLRTVAVHQDSSRHNWCFVCSCSFASETALAQVRTTTHCFVDRLGLISESCDIYVLLALYLPCS